MLCNTIEVTTYILTTNRSSSWHLQSIQYLHKTYMTQDIYKIKPYTTQDIQDARHTLRTQTEKNTCISTSIFSIKLPQVLLFQIFICHPIVFCRIKNVKSKNYLWHLRVKMPWNKHRHNSLTSTAINLYLLTEFYLRTIVRIHFKGGVWHFVYI